MPEWYEHIVEQFNGRVLNRPSEDENYVVIDFIRVIAYVTEEYTRYFDRESVLHAKGLPSFAFSAKNKDIIRCAEHLK